MASLEELERLAADAPLTGEVVDEQPATGPDTETEYDPTDPDEIFEQAMALLTDCFNRLEHLAQRSGGKRLTVGDCVDLQSLCDEIDEFFGVAEKFENDVEEDGF